MKTKRILSLALALLMLVLTTISLASCKTSYEDETFYLKINTDANRNKTYSLNEILDKEAIEIVIPAEIEGIAVVNVVNTAFDGCTKLKKITFSENIEYIYHAKNKALSACTALEEIVFNCKIYRDGEFQINSGSENGVTLTLGKDFNVNSDIFAGSTNLKKVIIEDGCDAVTATSFIGCTKLETIEFGGTKEAWCNMYDAGVGDRYSHLIIGKDNEAYKTLDITVKCSDGEIVFTSGEAE